MKKTLLTLSVATALFAGSAVAADYEYEITPTIGGVMPEGNLDLDDQLSYGLRFGKNIHGYWFDQAELALEYAPSVDIDYTSGKDTNIFRGSLNFIKDIPMTKYFSFYGLVGAGVEVLSENERGNNNRPFVGYGAGMKYRLTEQLALKAEARHLVKLNASRENSTQNNLFYTLGLAYSFGGVAQPVPPTQEPVATPVVEKEVVEEVVVGDDDKDGVLNNADECPDTPQGVPVEENGCPKTISLHINFNFDKANILPKYDAEINKVADFMNKYPVYKVMLEGYTDSTGPEAYNMKLSDKRSASVAKALENKGVTADRLSTAGYGESNPVSPNTTREGRAENRRVDAVFSY